MPYVSYKAVKELTTIETIAHWLGLRLTKDRAACPHAGPERGRRAITINREWQNKDGSFGRFKCWSCNVEGDLIALAAHINKTDDNQAAHEIQRTFGTSQPQRTPGLPKDGVDNLLFEHPRVQALNITPETAAQYGIGYRDKGTTRKALLFPLRSPTGELLGYVIQNEDLTLRLPKNLQSS